MSESCHFVTAYVSVFTVRLLMKQTPDVLLQPAVSFNRAMLHYWRVRCHRCVWSRSEVHLKISRCYVLLYNNLCLPAKGLSATRNMILHVKSRVYVSVTTHQTWKSPKVTCELLQWCGPLFFNTHETPSHAETLAVFESQAKRLEKPHTTTHPPCRWSGLHCAPLEH